MTKLSERESAFTSGDERLEKRLKKPLTSDAKSVRIAKLSGGKQLRAD